MVLKIAFCPGQTVRFDKALAVVFVPTKTICSQVLDAGPVAMDTFRTYEPLTPLATWTELALLAPTINAPAVLFVKVQLRVGAEASVGAVYVFVVPGQTELEPETPQVGGETMESVLRLPVPPPPEPPSKLSMFMW